MSIEALSVRGLRPECGKVDRDLWLWFCKAKKDSENYHGPPVTKRLVQAKAKQAFKDAGILNFKASNGWYIRWLKRWHRIGGDITNQEENKVGPSGDNSSQLKVLKKRPAKKPTSQLSKVSLHNDTRGRQVNNKFAGGLKLTSPIFNNLDQSANYECPINMPLKETHHILNFSENETGQNSLMANNFVPYQTPNIQKISNGDSYNAFSSKNNDAQVTEVEQTKVDKSFHSHSITLTLDERTSSSTPLTCDLGAYGAAPQTFGSRNIDTITSSERSAHLSKLTGTYNEKFLKPSIREFKPLKLIKPLKGSKIGSESNILPDISRSYIFNGSVQAYSSGLACLEKMPLEVDHSAVCVGIEPRGSHNVSEESTFDCSQNRSYLSVSSMEQLSTSEEQAFISFHLQEERIIEGEQCEHLQTSHRKQHACRLGGKASDLRVNSEAGTKTKVESLSCVARTVGNHFTLKESGGSINLNKDDIIRGNPVGNYVDIISDNAESACETFAEDMMVQHDFEDVSVSSDFVNQLNDEHFFDLSLEYENESHLNQLPPGITLENYKMHTEVNPEENHISQPIKSANHSHIATSDQSVEGRCNLGLSGLVNADHSEPDEDFSNEVNDYISKAVLLSMQEDDFSILNCDQSPFQGTLSVIDENSQSECDKVTELEANTGSMDESSASQASIFGNGQIVFPHPSPIEEMVQDGNVTSGTNRGRSEIMTGKLFGDHIRNSLSLTSGQNVTGVNDSSYISLSSGKEIGSEKQAILISSQGSHMVDKKLSESHHEFTPLTVEGSMFRENSNIFVTSLCSGDGLISEAQDMPQINPDRISNLDGQGVFQLSPSLCESSVAKTHGNFGVCSSMNTGVVIEDQDVLQISSSDDGSFVRAQDVLLKTCYSNEGKFSILQHDSCSSSLSEDRVTNCPEVLLPMETGSSTHAAAESNSLFIVPCSAEEVDSNNSRHLSISNVVIGNCVPACNSFDLFTFDVHDTNADSTTFLLMQSPLESNDDNPKQYISLSPQSSALCGNGAPLVTSSTPDFDIEQMNLTPHQGLSNSGGLLKCNPELQLGSSSKSINCETTKENGLIFNNIITTESVVLKQNDAQGNTTKLLRNDSACLKEKGSNVTRKLSAVQDKQTTCRRSSGDRYFPYFKERVADYAIKHTAKEAAQYFGVNVDTVTMWTRGRYERDSVIRNYPDQVMLRWLKKSRESGVVLTKEQIVEKAVQLLRTPGNWLKDKSRWFYIWASRLADEKKKSNNQPSSDNKVSKPLPFDCLERKAFYPDEFKVEVVFYAEQTSKNLASSIFNIARKRVFEWSAALKLSKKTQEGLSPANIGSGQNTASQIGGLNVEENKISSVSSPPLSSNGLVKTKLNGKGLGRAVTNVTVDRELWEWFCEQTAKKSKPKSKEIRSKAVELFRAHNHDKIQCSHGWLKKWSMRYGIALRHEGDGDLLAWCLEQFDQNKNISHRDLLNKAHESLTGTHKSEFKASAGWLVRFCKRHRNLLSTKPTVDVEIPTVLKHCVSEFRLQIQHLIQSSKIPFESVGSVDEVPLNFTAAGAGGSRSRLLLRRSGLENCHATVILSCLANGELLPPAVIFKGDGPTEHLTFDGLPLLALYQQDCCMSANIMLQWLDFVWTKRVTSPSILIADSYDPHCEESVIRACKAASISLSIIPNGCSYKLQPLDLAISRQFEANIYNRWSSHFSDVDQLSTCRKTTYTSNSDIARWVADAFITLKSSRKEAVRRSFLVTGLTIAADGSEDQLLEDPTHIPFSSLFTS